MPIGNTPKNDRIISSLFITFLVSDTNIKIWHKDTKNASQMTCIFTKSTLNCKSVSRFANFGRCRQPFESSIH